MCEGRRPTIYGDGEQTRDFTYVANVVDGVLRACDGAASASGEVINVATGGRISLNELFQTIRNLVGGDIEPIYAEPRAGDVRDSQADITKARRLLGYEPKATFEEGLARTVAWYRTRQTPTALTATRSGARCPRVARMSSRPPPTPAPRRRRRETYRHCSHDPSRCRRS